MRGIFATHGLPVLVVSDNSPCFSSQEFKMFMKNNWIWHIFTVPYHPSSNGQVERSVRTFKEAMKKMEADRKATLETKVSRFLFTYRTTPNTATGIPPAELMFKRRLRTAFHLLKPDTYQVLGYKNRMEQRTKVRAPLRGFMVNDSVLLCNFGSGQRWMEGTTITRQLGAVNFEVETDGRLLRRHTDQLLKLPPRREVEGIPEVQMDNTTNNSETSVVPEIPGEIPEPETTQMDDSATVTGEPTTLALRDVYAELQSS